MFVKNLFLKDLLKIENFIIESLLKVESFVFKAIKKLFLKFRLLFKLGISNSSLHSNFEFKKKRAKYSTVFIFNFLLIPNGDKGISNKGSKCDESEDSSGHQHV